MPRSTTRTNVASAPRGVGPALRDHLVDATIALVDESQDESRISLRAMARAAGVAAPSIYPHFPDRDALLAAAMDRSWEQLLDEIVASATAARTPRTRLLRGCQAYVAFAQRHPLRYSLMTRSTTASPAARRALELLTTSLTLTCDDTAPRGIPVSRGAAALSTALHGLASMHRSDAPSLWLGGFTQAQVLETVVDAAITATAKVHPPRR
jgi:AcrR family transcriptional regulator